MKKLIFLAAGIIGTLAVSAQGNPNFPKVAAPPKTAVTVTPVGFETSLVQGTLTLNKSFKQGDGKEFTAVYTLQKNDAYFNGKKPVQITLSRQSFDSVFTKTTADLAGKWTALNKYIEDNKLSLTTEGAWVTLITQFNGMR
ncbi:MAG: hypothetical protein V4450_03165 [Bacteroidota bacterium]